MSLTRRVHLAVLAHIRHHYTRYDQLLKETTWENARKLVQSVCLDVLVKWRGDEENGRDQLDEIIREVVIISDTEDDDEESDEDDSEDEDEDDEEEDEAEETGKTTQGLASTALPHAGEVPRREASVKPKNNKARKPRWSKRERKDRQMADRKAQKRKKRLQGAQRKFSRYQAAWESALSRNRQNHGGDQPQPLTMSRSVSFGPHQHDGHLFRFSQPIPRPGLTSSEQVMVHGGGVPPGYESRPVLGDREEVVVGRVSPKAGYFQQPCPTEHEVAYGRQTHEIPLPSFNAEHRPLKHRLEDTLGRLPEDPYGEHPAPSHRSHAISRLPQGYREEEVVYRSTDLIPPPGRRQSPVYTPYLDDGPSKRRRVVADSPEPVGHSRPYEMVRTVTVDEPLERETMYLSQNRPAYDGFFPPSGRDVYNTEPRVSAPPPFRLDPTRDRMDPGSVHNSLRAAHDHRRTYDRRAVEVSSYESHSYHSRHRVEPRSEEVAGPRHYPQSPLRTPDYAHLTASQSMTDVVEHYRRPPPQYIPHPGSPTHSCMQNERVVYIDGGFSRARSVELASHPPLPSMSDNTRRLERLSVSSDRGVEPPFIVIREHGTHPSPANHAPHYHQSQSDVRPQPSLHSAHAERLAAWSTRPEDRRYDEYARPTAVVINHEEPPSRVWDASGRPQVPRPHGALPQAHMQERGCIYLD